MKTKTRYRILMFAPAFAPFGNPEAIVNSKLALAFLDAGWEIEVITRNMAEESSYNYGSAWNSPWNSLQEHTHIISYPRNTRLKRFLDISFSAVKTGYLIHGCRWAWHAFELACKLHTEKPFDVILSRALPDSAHLPAALFARKSGMPWIANWNDASGVKNLPPYGLGPSGILGYFQNKLVQSVAYEADVLTFPSERLKKYICQYLPKGSIEKSITIPHASLHLKYKPYLSGSTFTLCYAGHLSAQRNPSVFLESFAMFVRDSVLKPSAIFRIIGIQDKCVMELVEKFKIAEYVDCVGSLSYEETLCKLVQSDVNVILEAPMKEGVYLPSKFVDYVQVGRPILAVMPPEGEVSDILSAEGGGIAVDCNSSEAVLNALIDLYSHWQKGILHEKYGSHRLYRVFSPETIVNKYENIFSNRGKSTPCHTVSAEKVAKWNL